MGRLSGSLLLVGVLLIVAGVALWSPAAALLVAGVLTCGAGVLTISVDTRDAGKPGAP